MAVAFAAVAGGRGVRHRRHDRRSSRSASRSSSSSVRPGAHGRAHVRRAGQVADARSPRPPDAPTPPPGRPPPTRPASMRPRGATVRPRSASASGQPRGQLGGRASCTAASPAAASTSSAASAHAEWWLGGRPPSKRAAPSLQVAARARAWGPPASRSRGRRGRAPRSGRRARTGSRCRPARTATSGPRPRSSRSPARRTSTGTAPRPWAPSSSTGAPAAAQRRGVDDPARVPGHVRAGDQPGVRARRCAGELVERDHPHLDRRGASRARPQRGQQARVLLVAGQHLVARARRSSPPSTAFTPSVVAPVSATSPALGSPAAAATRPRSAVAQLDHALELRPCRRGPRASCVVQLRDRRLGGRPRHGPDRSGVQVGQRARAPGTAERRASARGADY